MKSVLGHPIYTQDVFDQLHLLLQSPLEDSTKVRNVIGVDTITLFLKVKYSVWIRTGLVKYWCELVVYSDDTMLTMKTMLQQQYGLNVGNQSVALVNPATNEFAILNDEAEIRSIGIPLRDRKSVV